MKRRSDLLDSKSPCGVEVFQLTHEAGVSGAHVYMEAQVFSPDGRFLILERNGNAHNQTPRDPEHRYLVCDLQDRCRLYPLTDELQANAPSITPDGKWVYYLVDRSVPGGGAVDLKRVGLDGTGRETLMVIDHPLPGTRFRPSRIYPLSTISSDGKKLAAAAYLGDGRTPDAPWGLMLFDLERNAVELILHGPTWCNLHPQFCRSTDPAERHLIMVQENHGNACDAAGNVFHLVSGAGADIHLIRDDGAWIGTFPWGRQASEHCQGHQCWRGTSTWGIGGIGKTDPPRMELIESRAIPAKGHPGKGAKGGRRNNISRSFPKPWFQHFATDRAGRRLVTDCGPMEPGGTIYLADLGTPGRSALSNWTYLLNTRCNPKTDYHIHPFLSPDGSAAFFNSNESGRLQAYMVRNLPCGGG